MNKLLKLLLIIITIAITYTGYGQVKNSFKPRYDNSLKGDLTIIANNIVNREGDEGYWTGPSWNRTWVSVPRNANDPYNQTGSSSTYNDSWNMQYIDIDGDSDTSTFSSSSSTLTVPDASCSLVRYAGLYWSAVYRNTDRSNIDNIKFKVPGGSYMDISADEILFDGNGDTDFGFYSPYACYKDITSIITGLADPNGDYTVANVRASSGNSIPGGVSGGWTMVVVYENPNYPGKYITTFDGYAGIKSGETVDIPISGFTTLPNPFPVNARLGVSTLEGDNRISGDGLSIKANSKPLTDPFIPLGNTVNPTNNFFNSNITIENTIVNTRSPNSINTLGWDADLFTIPNPARSVIPNNETGAVLRASSSRDKYDIFFTSFDVEIIEPKINLAKRVEDIGGTDITGQGVNLGQILDYVLTFQNVGNDDADEYTIRDVLPQNVTLDENNFTLPAGVTYTYNAGTRTVLFTIPNNLVPEGGSSYSIRMRVKVAENCFDFVDACSDLIQNLAYSTYKGVLNSNQITDDPSVTDFDSCGFTTPGATNFLLDDLESCDYSRTVQLCGANILLDAGDNFDDYIWYKDENNNRIIDAGDTVLNDGNPDNDLSTLIVDDIGIYIVDKIVADPCKGFQEIITVERFGITQTNPISALINDTSNTVEGEVTICPIDGDPLPKVFLCGLNDVEPITINIPDASSIQWQKLDENSCTASIDDCANKNGTCTWNNVESGSTFLASDAGQYRLIINYQNGCFSRFYFNVFKNLLDPQYTSNDIICTTPGNITVTNIPADYEFQLLNAATNAVLVPFSANNGPSFTIANNGAYTIEIRQQGVVDGCLFMLENIGIRTRNYEVNITTKDTDCNGLGEIRISAEDVEPQYYFEVSQGGTTIDTYGPTDDNDYTFEKLSDGVYDVTVSTDDGCTHTEQITINDVSDLAGSALTTKSIDCTDGIITVTGTGGFANPAYSYAIWSKDGVNLYTDLSDIPASEFQANSDFTFDATEAGTYEFIVVDSNNCYAITNEEIITIAPAITYTTSVTNESCFEAEDGSYVVTVTASNGYTMSYSLLNPDGSTTVNGSGNFTNLAQGNYTLTITQTNGSDVCDFTETFTIGGPTSRVAGTAFLIQDYTCLQEAIIEAQNVTGGEAPYQYSIDGINFVGPSASAERFTNLTNGTYKITIRDAKGCTFVTNSISIDPLNGPTDLDFTATTPNCPTQTSDVTVTVTNGNTPFTFEIIAPSAIAATNVTGNTAIFNGLAPNTYTYKVTDAKGCSYEESHTIRPVNLINVVGNLNSNITCFNDTDGEATFTVSGFNTTYNYSITGPTAIPNGTAVNNLTIPLTNLDDGIYTITVTDTETNCTDTASVTINAPVSALSLTANETQPTCTTDGSVVLTATGGWGGNTFTITHQNSGTTFTNSTGRFNNLNQTGTFNISVEDANGCIVTSSFDLYPSIAPTLEIVPNNNCFIAAVGLELTANVIAGGDGAYKYRINGGAYAANNTFSNLNPGTYTIDVIDGNNCTGTASITVNPELTITATADTITACGTDTNVTITAAGGDGINYVYAIVDNGVTPNTGDFSTTNPRTITTGPGDYDVYVRDNNGTGNFCEAKFDLTINKRTPIVITETVTNVSCFGGNNGTISLAITGGKAPYRYSINNGADYKTTNSFSNLTAGTYPVLIQDSDLCTQSLNVTVNEPAEIEAEALQTKDYTCLPSPNNFAEITVGSINPTIGGSGNYQYSINGGAWTASTTGGIVFDNLIDGTYSIRVRDANATDCFITLPNVIIPALPTMPTLSSSITYNCDGSGNISISPFNASYTYTLGALVQTGASANVFNNIAPGNYTITVDYGSSCTTDIVVNVETGKAFGATITNPKNISCFGGNDGEFVINASNFGAGGFQYSINGAPFSAAFTTPQTITGLTAQNFTIEVRDVDDNTCTIPLTQELTQPTEVTATASITEEFTCNNTGATITAVANGGTPTYTYQLETNTGTVVRAYQSSAIFNNVPANNPTENYIVRVLDRNLCTNVVTPAITVTAPEVPTFTVTPTACYSGANDGEIRVDITSIPGNGNFQFRIDGGAWVTPTPVTATTYTFTGLANGSYNIDVKDGYGCVGVQETVVLNPVINATIDVVHISSCADGSITVNANGGDGNLAYAFVTTGTPVTAVDFNPSNTFTVIPANAGTYDVYVWDNNAADPHCEYMETVTVNPATPLTYNAAPTDPTCHDGTGTIEITVTSGIAPYTYQIIDLDNGGASNETTTNVINNTKTFFNLAPGNYTINVTDASGCTIETTPVLINNPDELVTDIESILSGNCDPATGFRFINYTTTLSGTLEFSHDGGTTWQTSDEFNAPTYTLTSGDAVDPSIRTVDASGNTLCRLDLPRYIIAYPLDNLDITIGAVIVDCNDLQVTVQGNEGTAPYQYTYTDDPVNFDATTPSNPWTTPAKGLADPHVFTGLVPGRTYVFYVRDANGCVRQSDINVNDLITLPLEITSTSVPACFGMTNGSITYTITDNQAPFGNEYRWEVFNMITGTPVSVANSGGNIPFSSPQSVTVSGLGAGEYFIQVTERDSGVDSCISASENLLLEELDDITATLNKIQDISCATPGLIQIENINGGGGIYTFTVTGPAPFTTITGTTDNPIEIPANSPAGTYNVTIQDQYSCDKDLGDVIMTLTPNPTIDSIDVNNCAIPNTLQINATSTAAQILYSIDGGVTYVDNGGLFTNLSVGTYNISIKDSNGCIATDSATIYPILEANVELTKLMDCTPGTAEITIEAINGSGDYDYEITNGLGTVVARTSLATNPLVATVTVVENYTVTVYDNNTSGPECSRVFTIEVLAAVTPIFTETHTNLTCNASNDGTITLYQTDNGINPLTYTISPVAGTFDAATSTFSDLPPNTYTVTATGTNGCTENIVGIVIDNPAVIADINTTIVEFGCTIGNTSNNASISINNGITGGSGTYVIYEFINNNGTPATGDDVTVQSSSNTVYIETNTSGGSYTINVYDDKGCVGSTTATILPYDELLTPTITVDDNITCSNAGEDITINAFGSLTDSSTPAGLANYEFRELPSGIFQASNQFTNLAIGDHTFEVRNVNTNCVATISHKVIDPNTFDITVTKLNDVICYGTETGQVTFELTDATYSGPINWVIYDTNGTVDRLDDTPVKNNTFATNGPTAPITLEAGSYLVEIFQVNNPQCSNVEAFTIAGPSAAITAATDITPVTCAGNDGVIEIINAAGGWGNYTYFVDIATNPAPTFPGSYQTSPRFTGLSGAVGPAGTDYQVWIADKDGCVLQLANVNLVEPTPISATLQVNQENCTNLEGEIQVIGTVGGQGSNYTYQLIKNGTAVGSPQTTTIFSGLGEGSYTVLINDQWSCSFTTLATVLYEEMNVTTTVVKPIDCSTTDPGGQITVNVNGGSSNLEFIATLPVSGTTITNNTGVFTGLMEVGIYSFTVRDLDTNTPVCEKPVTQELTDKVDPILLASTIKNVSCFGLSDGSITANLDPTTNVDPIYTYNLYDATGTTQIGGNQTSPTSPTFTGLPAAFYQIEVISAKGCSVRQTVEVTQPTELLISAVATEFVCATNNTVNMATITVTIEDGATTPGTPSGTSPYLYSIDNVNFQTANTFSVVDTGIAQTITIYVTDGNSCPQTTTVTIEPINTFTAVVTKDADISCVGPEEITITVTDNGDAINVYTYELLPIGNTNATQTGTPTYNTATFNLTAVGGYVFRVTDTTTGCYVDTIPYDISPYNLIKVEATATSSVTCFGDTNGTIDVTVTDATGPFTYTVLNADGTLLTPSITNTVNTNTFTISGLSGGNYYVAVKEDNAPECTADSNIITIASPDMPLTAIVNPTADVTCDNDRGEILVDPSGGYAPYDIVLTNTTTSDVYSVTDVLTHTFQTLGSGNYTVSITDANGCVYNDTEVLVAATRIVADITPLTTVLTCFGDTTGSVSANVSGGQGVYQYQLNVYDATGTVIISTSGKQASNTFNNLGAGRYSITVSDGWNCMEDTIQAVISEPSDVSGSLVQLSPLTCVDPARIQLTATGGTAPYQFSTDGINFTSMSSGDTHIFTITDDDVYQYYVRDNFNCGNTISNQVSIDAVPDLEIILDESAAIINCSGESTASINATAIGGMGNYSYELLDSPTSTTPLDGPKNTGDFRNISSGTYYIKVTSDGGCEEISRAINITEPNPLQIDTEEYTDVACANEDNGTITVEVSGGTGIILYAISPNLNQFDTKNVFTDLAPGVYDVIAQDENGCFIPFNFTITEPQPIQLSATTVGETCTGNEDGMATVTIVGGIAPYSTSIDSNDPADYVLDRVDFTGLSSGAHVIFIKDANGCDANIVIDIAPGVNLKATATPIYECSTDTPTNYLEVVLEDNTITDVLYGVDTTDPTVMQLTPDFANIPAGDHYLYIMHENGCTETIDFTVEAFDPLTLVLENTNINEITAITTGGKPKYTFYIEGNNNGEDNTFRIHKTDTYTVVVVDENGCEATQDIFIEFIDIEIPNFFTPNGDETNNTWKPKNTEGFPNILTIIYDRYGRELYRMGSNDKGWDGTYNNKELPSGDYWYTIKLKEEEDDREFVGHFTLYR